jgi:hypothetical protein
MKIRVVFPVFREFLGIFMNCKSLIISDFGKENPLEIALKRANIWYTQREKTSQVKRSGTTSQATVRSDFTSKASGVW